MMNSGHEVSNSKALGGQIGRVPNFWHGQYLLLQVLAIIIEIQAARKYHTL